MDSCDWLPCIRIFDESSERLKGPKLLASGLYSYFVVLGSRLTDSAWIPAVLREVWWSFSFCYAAVTMPRFHLKNVLSADSSVLSMVNGWKLAVMWYPVLRFGVTCLLISHYFGRKTMSLLMQYGRDSHDLLASRMRLAHVTGVSRKICL